MVDHNLFLLFSRKIIQVRQRSDPSRMKQSERCRQHFSESLFIVMFSFFCPFLLLFFFHPLFGYRKLWVDAAGSTPNRASRLCGTFSLLLLLPGHLFSVNDTHKVKKRSPFGVSRNVRLSSWIISRSTGFIFFLYKSSH